jgi:hypothetical protein
MDDEPLVNRLPESATPALFAGVVFGASWWLWFDAVFVQSRMGWEPSIDFWMWWPGIIATAGAFFLAITPPRAFSDRSFSSSNEPGSHECIRFYVFCALMFGLFGILMAIFYLAMVFHPSTSYVEHWYPGVALLGQTFGIMASGSIVLFGRLPEE